MVRAAQLGVREGVIGDRRTRVTGAAPDAHLAGVLGPDVAAQGAGDPRPGHSRAGLQPKLAQAPVLFNCYFRMTII